MLESSLISDLECLKIVVNAEGGLFGVNLPSNAHSAIWIASVGGWQK